MQDYNDKHRRFSKKEKITVQAQEREEVKRKDRPRKKIVNGPAAIVREHSKELAKSFHQKERERKQPYMLTKNDENKSKEIEKVKFFTPQEDIYQ